MWTFGNLLLTLSLLQFGCPRLRTNECPQSNFTRHLLCYAMNMTIPSQDPLFLINPPPNSTTYLCLSHFFPISCQCFIKQYDTLHSITLYSPISAPFFPPPPSSDPFATRHSKVGQVTIASPAPGFYPSTPALPELKQEESSDFFDYATRNCTLH